MADYLILSLTLLGIALYGLLTRRNLLKVLISIELLAFAASMNFIMLATPNVDQNLGQVFLILTYSTDSSITAIVLAILIIITKRYGTWDLQKLGVLMKVHPIDPDLILEEAGEKKEEMPSIMLEEFELDNGDSK